MKRKELRLLHHADLVSFITEFEKEKKGSLSYPRRKIDADAVFEISRKECQITFDFNYFMHRKHIDVGTIFPQCTFIWNNKELKVDKLFLSNGSINQISGSSQSVSSKGFAKNKKAYLRLVIPVKESQNFHFYINPTIYANDYGITSSVHVQAKIENHLMEAYYFDDKKGNHFFGIETASKIDYEDFANKAFAIKNAVGFITGRTHGNYGYFFSYNKKDMKNHNEFRFSTFRDSMITNYTPSNSNPYSYIRKAKATAEKLYKDKTLRPFSFEEFSTLTERLYTSGDFTAIIMLMMECGTASLLFRPGGYSIALESLSDLILGDDKLNLAPIKIKKTSQDFRKALNKVVDEYNDRIDDEGILALKRKVEQINQTTNKARLRAPFEKLGIELLPADLEVLETRNDFLHGRIPDFSKLGIDREDDIKNKDMFYASIRLYTLLNMLILKWIGYDNYVLNYPKIHEGYCKIKLKEPYYRKV